MSEPQQPDLFSTKPAPEQTAPAPAPPDERVPGDAPPAAAMPAEAAATADAATDGLADRPTDTQTETPAQVAAPGTSACDALVAEWAERMAQAARNDSALCIRGGGSKAFYGEPTPELTDVLDTRAYAGVISYEPTELVITARAGTPLTEVEALLASQGQCLPFEPPRHRWLGADKQPTLGGMVAAGLSGPARANVGCVRDHVLGVGLLNGRGQALRFGGQVIKNVAGYDVSRVMAGSLGTLGVILDVSLKVLPVAALDATLSFDLTQADALAALHRWGAQPLPLSASVWLPEEAPHTGRLLLRLRGAAAAVNAACERLLREAPAAAKAARWDESAKGSGEATAFWNACRDQRLPFFTHPTMAGDVGTDDVADLCLWRLSVPQTAPVLKLPNATLVEWHGAQRWVWAPASASAALRAQAHAVGGHATLFVAPMVHIDAANLDLTLVPTRFSQPSTAIETIHRRLKAEFDPHRVLNPGRMFRWM